MNKKSRIICVIIGLLIVAEVITLTGILYYSPNLVLKRTIKNAVANHESDVIFSLNKIECIADISSADTNQNSKLALLSGTNENNENCYGIVAVNSENKTIEDIYFGTTELQIFMAHIFINEDYTVNMANFENWLEKSAHNDMMLEQETEKEIAKELAFLDSLENPIDYDPELYAGDPEGFNEDLFSEEDFID